MATGNMTLNLKIWRQKDQNTEGKLVDYRVEHVSPDMSFLEMIDVLNEQLGSVLENPDGFDIDSVLSQMAAKLAQGRWTVL